MATTKTTSGAAGESHLARDLPAMAPIHETIGRFNRIGLYTLYMREVRRYLAVWQQTLAAPVVTTLLFYVVFALAFGGAERQIYGQPFMAFLAPGLIMMNMAQNAFMNTSSSLVIAKVQGNIVDVLMPPVSPLELTLGYAAGGVTRGLMVGLVAGVVMVIFADLTVQIAWVVVVQAVLGCLLLSLMGMAGGVWAEKFDHIAAVTNFFVTPLTFLSGTFFTLQQLPQPWNTIAQLNPFFYMIDGFRAGFTGHAESDLGMGVAIMLGANLALGVLVYRMFRRGYNLKP